MGARIDLRREDGLSRLEWLGIVAGILLLLAMIPVVRDFMASLVGLVFNRRDPTTGEVTAFSQLMRGIGITIGAVIVFIGSAWLVLMTNLGRRLAFLLVGAATTGWLTMGGLLFVVFAPRGARPANLEGLNAFQMRIPALAMTLGAAVLFAMFVVALDRYEHDEPGGA